MRKEKKLTSFLMFSTILILMFSCNESQIDPDIKGHISGVVKDAETLETLENATIITSPASEVAISDSLGRFYIYDLDTGSYSITAEVLDYQNRTLNVKVKRDDTTFVSFLLKKKTETSSAYIPEFTEYFYPENGSINQGSSVRLAWKAEDKNDSLKYDVYLYESNDQNRRVIAEDVYDTTVTIHQLNFNRVYYWQVVVEDEDNNIVKSDMLSFSTISAFQNTIYYSTKVNGNYEIYGYDEELELHNRITFNGFRDIYPKANRSLGKVAYISDSLDIPYLFIMDFNGANQKKVSGLAIDGNHNYGNAFAWNKITGELYFSNYNSIYKVFPDGTGLTKVLEAPAYRHFREIDISPNGEKMLAMLMSDTIYVSEIVQIDIETKNITEIIANMPGIISNPRYSIDGSSMLFSYDVSEHQDMNGRQLNAHIYHYNFNSQDTLDISTSKSLGTNDLYAMQSPRGDMVIFMNQPNDGSSEPKIYRMDIDGTDRVELFTGAFPDWN